MGCPYSSIIDAEVLALYKEYRFYTFRASITAQPQNTKLPHSHWPGVSIYLAAVYIRKPASQVPSAYRAQNAVLSLQHLQLATDLPPPTSGRAKLCRPHLSSLTANIPSHHAFCRAASERVTKLLRKFCYPPGYRLPFYPRMLSLDYSQLQTQKSCHPAGLPVIIWTRRRFQIAGATW